MIQHKNEMVAKKILQIALAIARRPNDLVRYLLHAPFRRTQPLDLELPWISYAAIDFLDAFLTSQLECFEWGSGGSTLFFQKRVKTVCSLEHNRFWFERVMSYIEQNNTRNAELLFQQPPSVSQSLHESDYVNPISHRKLDVILVDGHETDSFTIRPACFKASEKHIRPGRVILVDDSWRYPQLRDQNTAKRVEIFESLGPCRYSVTSTAAFFY